MQRIAALYEQHGQRLSIATIDQDATIVESHKRAAFAHYRGGRGYQPLLALWAEADLIVADQFRDGNVPARQEPLTCCQMAFAALPETVTTCYFRGDSACYESNLLDWLSSPEREQEPGGAHRLRHQRRDEPAVGPDHRRAARARMDHLRHRARRHPEFVVGVLDGASLLALPLQQRSGLPLEVGDHM